jgi:hypothetical protein
VTRRVRGTMRLQEPVAAPVDAPVEVPMDAPVEVPVVRA